MGAELRTDYWVNVLRFTNCIWSWVTCSISTTLGVKLVPTCIVCLPRTWEIKATEINKRHLSGTYYIFQSVRSMMILYDISTLTLFVYRILYTLFFIYKPSQSVTSVWRVLTWPKFERYLNQLSLIFRRWDLDIWI